VEYLMNSWMPRSVHTFLPGNNAYQWSVMRVFISLLALLNILILFSLGRNFRPHKVAAAAPTLSPTPTVDRLAEPTLPPNPSQADLGSQAFWLNCLPCHGDQGQGLTDEFRALYPEEDRYCWNSGCHGPHPYQNGWTLPTKVPRLIGEGALDDFETAANLHKFISSAMPYQAPGTLDEETYWQLTAFLLRQNQIGGWREPLGPENAAEVSLKSPAAQALLSTPSSSIARPQSRAVTPTSTASVQPLPNESGRPFDVATVLLGLLLIVLAIALAVTRLVR
jgi:mono/diheme cytochrome c family protein